MKQKLKNYSLFLLVHRKPGSKKNKSRVTIIFCENDGKAALDILFLAWYKAAKQK